ncbi:MAG: ATP-binding SpoIIE family protein phosphatase, partial [Gammaproteobacteria bacterium]
AIGSIPVADVFHIMLAKGYSFHEILTEINNKLYKLLPTQMFMAAAYVSVDRLNNVVSVINAGLPDIYIIRENQIVHEFKSKNIPLGIKDMQADHFDIQMERIGYGDKLLMASDGIVETENSSGEIFAKHRLDKCIENSPQDGDLLREILAASEGFSLGKQQGDDITLLELVHLENTSDNKPADSVEITEPGEWSVAYQLDLISLKKLDFLSHIMQYINNLQSIPNGRSTIYTILSEVYNNALDHGLLKLDSSLKDSAQGYLNYYKERTRRLEEMSTGMIHVSLKHEVRGKDSGRLIIELVDTGEGFDYQQYTDDHSEQKKYSGRGISLLRKLCTDVKYSAKGNQVKLVYDWHRS